eukprot:3682097-Pyramimonas_sp.AAC.1
MATTRLAQLRSTLTQALFGTPKGRCRTLEFMLSVDPKSDPNYDAHSLPVLMWGQAARQNWIQHKIMVSSFREFHSRAARGWQDVRGPAGA